MKQGWEIKTIADVCTFIKNGANIKQERGAGGVPITRIETLSGGVFNRDRLGYANLETPDKYVSYVLEYGDLLFSHINSKTYIGRTVVYVPENDEQIIHGMNLLRLKLDFDLISPFFFQYYTRTDKFKAQVANRRKDAVNQSSITTTDIKTISLPVPPIAEQEKIVAELDCLSGIIEKKKQQLKELDNLAQSIFYEMFGNPLRNERGWGLKRIADVCVVNPPKKVTAQGLGNKDVVSFLPMEDLPIKACYHQPDKTRLYEEVQASYTCFANDDVLMAKVTPCFENGKLGIATNLHNGVGYGSSEFIVIRANNVDVLKEYIYFVTMDSLFIEKACAQLTGTSGLRRVPRQYVENCNITLPPLMLQQQFASKIKSIEKQKELIAQSIKKTETLFNSRMDYYFN